MTKVIGFQAAAPSGKPRPQESWSVTQRDIENLYDLRREARIAKRRFDLACRAVYQKAIAQGARDGQLLRPWGGESWVDLEGGRVILRHEDWRQTAAKAEEPHG